MLISWLILLSSIVNGGTAPAAAVPAAVIQPTSPPKQWQLDGIQLGATAREVKEAWGRPTEITPGDWLNECDTWIYDKEKNVGMCDGIVSFVQVTVNAKKANLDGQVIPMGNKDLRQALGRPEFEADDGWGIVHGAEALKVFVNENGDPVSLDLFSDPCNL
ncbi:hypothetical protein [Cohnella lupini]|uniref:Uncharacterized protein n=1 Tax=Cohnella lupini TaxID=1294267 RepID=A0A3D9I5G8_9BACL|nr:hypothetical protein [Cohnella lupini]RED56769.1 hypothetical protein DFP95_11260 [Cohnella lupini]